MPTPMWTRRKYLQTSAMLGLAAQWPTRAFAARQEPASAAQLAAAWNDGEQMYVGIVQASTATPSLQTLRAEPVPTRAHGMAALRDGSLIFASRRPGDWLVRLRPDSTAAQWLWIETDRAFNGHVIESADGRHLYTTETDLDNGQGLIGVRDASTLEKIAEWPSGSMDPHQLLLDSDGSLVVANGGIPSQTETGRRKLRLDHMDSSIARLLPTARGAMAGQWRLPDPRLSLRHLSWGPQVAWAPQQRWLGIALQAEHDAMAARAQAPVLAFFDGSKLHAAPLPGGVELAGYGGDIGCTGQHFAVSCPRANQLTWWQPPASENTPGAWQGSTSLDGVYSVSNRSVSETAPAPDSSGLWVAGGAHAAYILPHNDAPHMLASVQGKMFDNHWIPLKNS